MRNFYLGTVTDISELRPPKGVEEHLPRDTLNTTEGWLGVIGDRKLSCMYACEFGFAEEVIALMFFEDGTSEVGIGESLRPYLKVYEGKDLEKALQKFFEVIQDLARDDSDDL